MSLRKAISRRVAFRLCGSQTLGLAMAQAWLSSPLLAAGNKSEALQRFPRMMQRYFMQQVRDLDTVRTERLDRIQTKADAVAYIKSVRGKIQR